MKSVLLITFSYNFDFVFHRKGENQKLQMILYVKKKNKKIQKHFNSRYMYTCITNYICCSTSFSRILYFYYARRHSFCWNASTFLPFCPTLSNTWFNFGAIGESQYRRTYSITYEIIFQVWILPKSLCTMILNIHIYGIACIYKFLIWWT